MSIFTIPTWMRDALQPEALAALEAKAFETQLRAVAPMVADVVGTIPALETPESTEDLLVIVNHLQRKLTEIRAILDPTPATEPTRVATSKLTAAQTSAKEAYERPYYWTMAHLPADLQGKKYREIKTDARVVVLWKQAVELDGQGRLTRSGKEK